MPTKTPIARKYPDGTALCRAVLEETGPTALLSFSTGKDSIAAWLKLREAGFTRIVPFYLYVVPGLEFVEERIKYYEDKFGTPIMRLPDPKILRMIRAQVYMPPPHAAIVEELWPARRRGELPSVPQVTFDELADHVRAVHGLSANTYVAVGTRAADSIARRTNFARTGQLNPTRRQFFPVFDWSIEDVRVAIRGAGLTLNPEYRWYGRTFDSLTDRCLGGIKENAPRDYQRILDFFPLAELSLFRRTLGGARVQAQDPQ